MKGEASKQLHWGPSYDLMEKSSSYEEYLVKFEAAGLDPAIMYTRKMFDEIFKMHSVYFSQLKR